MDKINSISNVWFKNTIVQKTSLVLSFTALTAIGAHIVIPIQPVPFTMQIFFVILSGLLLGAKLGFISQIIYIISGIVGIPVFANGGGIQYILSPSFGYTIGFALATLVVGLVKEKIFVNENNFMKYFISSLLALMVCYTIGIIYLYSVLNLINHGNISFISVLISGCILFLPSDILKITLASIIARDTYSKMK
ncbi:MAG: hypothetical protein A2Y24_08615 [Clostridiales bacterium GWE2_32_10]|nr:MAG: hypothetical protein A2Y24_08615 [Clostridiales bacterium GWE2_32_10]HBY20820.1 biotin transporter BioY [Clostridiales bacterium]